MGSDRMSPVSAPSSTLRSSGRRTWMTEEKRVRPPGRRTRRNSSRVDRSPARPSECSDPDQRHVGRVAGRTSRLGPVRIRPRGWGRPPTLRRLRAARDRVACHSTRRESVPRTYAQPCRTTNGVAPMPYDHLAGETVNLSPNRRLQARAVECRESIDTCRECSKGGGSYSASCLNRSVVAGALPEVLQRLCTGSRRSRGTWTWSQTRPLQQSCSTDWINSSSPTRSIGCGPICVRIGAPSSPWAASS